MKNAIGIKIAASNFRVFICFIIIFSVLKVQAQCDFKAIGHRGGSSYYYPENTLVSLEQGFMEGIFAAEVDIQLTADNVLVLMHDYYVDRTTNGSGDIENLSLDYLKTLDAGSWKDSIYSGTPVATLYEALKLAEKYQKKLYLNMKVFAPELLAQTLKDAGAAEDMILVDPDDQGKVEIYHQILPNTPQVYFGEIPEDIDDPEFYNFLKNNGVIAIEIPADDIYISKDDFYEKLRDIAHSHQIELWAYTVNDPAYFKFLKDFGIDALETDRPSEAIRAFCDNSYGGYFPEKLIAGQWDFNFNLSGTIGSQLVLMGDSTTEGQKIKFGTTGSFGLPPIENLSVNIARIPAFDSEHALRFFSNIAPEGIPGGLACDNTYSLVFDLLVPSGNDYYTSILQTANSNYDDGDFFLLGETNSFGILENYNGSFEDSTWVRMALVFNLYEEKLETYLNGEYVATIELEDSQDGRFCLNNNWGVQSSNFFSDNDGETNPVFVSSIQLRNYSMNSNEIKGLGGPKSSKISGTVLPDSLSNCPEFESGLTDSIAGNVIHLSAFAGDSVNYRWEMNTGWGWENIQGINFVNSASPRLKILYSEEMLGYKFRCLAFNDCQVFSNEYILKDINTGLKTSQQKELLSSVYPNPSKGKVTIDFNDPTGLFSVQIFNIYGSEIINKSNIQNRLELYLSKGTYIVRIQNNAKSEIKKLLVTD